MNRLQKAWYILRYLGPRIIWMRSRLAGSKVLGRSRKTFAPRPWERINLQDITQPGTPASAENYARHKKERPPTFLFPFGAPPPVPDSIRQGPVERQPALAERLRLLALDRCVYFFRQIPDEKIDWYANPIDNKHGDPRKCWTEVPFFQPEQGDIRTLWEPARAAWAIDFARARGYGLKFDGELFWRWVDSWMDSCPPFMGVQWVCGQEAAVRLIAIALGFWSLADDPATTPERWLQFARLAWATGYRIAHHINYAISQKNNHAISEAVGLLLVSHLFPEFRESPRWHALGRRVLAHEIRRQIYADGSYIQHSMNYHRVMLQGAILGLRLVELADAPFERDIYDRLRRAGEFLFQMMDPATGRLPQYGHNDGAWILPLDECDFNDYRPVIQATHYLCTHKRLLPAGAWDEDLLWLFGVEALQAEAVPPRQPVSTAFEAGGYYTLRGDNTWAMIRCHTYRDRPGHCDPLHLDLWWRGQNIFLDCGTFQYYVPGRPDLEYYFKSIAAHNCIEIDGQNPLELVSRFLWLPWPRARKTAFTTEIRSTKFFSGEHYDYGRRPWNVKHARNVWLLAKDKWLIEDRLSGEDEHDLILRWHLADVPYEVNPAGASLRLHTPAGDACVKLICRTGIIQRFEVIRGRDEPGRVQGFASPYYAEKRPIPVLEVSLKAALPQTLMTVVTPEEPAEVKCPDDSPFDWVLVWRNQELLNIGKPP